MEKDLAPRTPCGGVWATIPLMMVLPPLPLLLLLLAVPAPAGLAGGCDSALRAACTGAAGGPCEVCAGRRQRQLKQAGCSHADIEEWCSSAGRRRIQYVLFEGAAKGLDLPGGLPPRLQCAAFANVSATVGAPADRSIRVGVGMVISLLAFPLPAIQAMLGDALRCSAQTRVPLFVSIDGEAWWTGSPGVEDSGLWNWWDESGPGYDPANVVNVERTGWASNRSAEPLKISWRNWGQQVRLGPAPNLHSPAIWARLRPRIAAVAGQVAAWASNLPPSRQSLFAGVKVGWESAIGTGGGGFYYPRGNSFLERWPSTQPCANCAGMAHDPQSGTNFSLGIAGGVQQIGFASAASAGLPQEGSTLSRETVGQVVNMYIANLTAAVHAAGVPADKIFTHMGPQHPIDEYMPLTTAVAPLSHPGWSVYSPIMRPPDRQAFVAAMQEAGRTAWAAVEFGMLASSRDEWLSLLGDTLSFLDCRLVDIYGGIERFAAAPGSLEALRQIISAAPSLPPERAKTDDIETQGAVLGCVHGVRVRSACICVDGFSGERCDEKPDPCLWPAPVRCLGKGSRCVDGACRAVADADSCAAVTCGKHGRCVDGACACDAGFSGADCADFDECASQPCRNGGTCLHSGSVRSEWGEAHAQLATAWRGHYRCACSAGYSGDSCQCPDCVEGFCGLRTGRCVCYRGFTGTRCDEERDECQSSPCGQHGECVDGHGEYSCRCDPGFAGRHCQMELDECLSTPCGRHGTCRDAVDGYSCLCESSWVGEHCSRHKFRGVGSQHIGAAAQHRRDL